MKSLYIAEKPSVAREIAKALKVPQRSGTKQGYIEGQKEIITWAIGHLVAIASPADHNPAWKTWKLSELPMIPEPFRLQPTTNGSGQFKVVKELLNRQDVDQVVCATDAGREGELIFRRIYWLAGCRKPIKRLWASDLTPAGLAKALANLMPGEDFDNLAGAALARSEADWLVGMNLSRLFSLLCQDTISQGRVQTPVLKMLADRRQEIERFVPQDYWVVQGVFSAAEGEVPATNYLPPEYDQARHWIQEEAEKVRSTCLHQAGTVLSVQTKKGQQKAPLLFDLTTLQREVNRKYGLSAKETLATAQALYERHKIITYPRTDSRYLSSDVFTGIDNHLVAVEGIYPELVQNVRSIVSQNTSFACVNDAKVTDHHAIIPTQKRPQPDALNLREKQVFDLIARRLLATFMPPFIYQATTIWIECNKERFKATGRIIVDKGWMEAEPWRKAENSPLPRVIKREEVHNQDLQVVKKKTTPPQHYTDESLLGVMETAGKQITDQELRAAIKDKGLGTPATRAQIIETLIQRGYVQRSRKKLMATDKGLEVSRVTAENIPQIVSPEMTGEWEQKLEHIARGQAGYQEFRQEISTFVAEIVSGMIGRELNYNAQQGETQNTSPDQAEAIGVCPWCGGKVVENAKAFGCANWKTKGCRFAIWKSSLGGRIGKQAARELIAKGQTSRQLTLKSKAGKKYKAKLVLNDQGKVKPVFQEQH